jgi:hypothetical protein
MGRAVMAYYIKVKATYNVGAIHERIAQLVNSCALNPPIWERDEKTKELKFPYNYELIAPASVIEMLPGEWVFLRGYTSEELIPLHEDKILFNERTQCAVPNAALWSVTDVRIETDLCTDMLQDMLASGWHILAICPQAQRRPDYVLGKGPQLKPQKAGYPAESPYPPPTPPPVRDEIPF